MRSAHAHLADVGAGHAAGERDAQRHEQLLALALLRLAQRFGPALERVCLARRRARQLPRVPGRHHRIRHLHTTPASLHKFRCKAHFLYTPALDYFSNEQLSLQKEVCIPMATPITIVRLANTSVTSST